MNIAERVIAVWKYAKQLEDLEREAVGYPSPWSWASKCYWQIANEYRARYGRDATVVIELEWLSFHSTFKGTEQLKREGRLS